MLKIIPSAGQKFPYIYKKKMRMCMCNVFLKRKLLPGNSQPQLLDNNSVYVPINSVPVLIDRVHLPSRGLHAKKILFKFFIPSENSVSIVYIFDFISRAPWGG
jgi:hypothetical protein